MNLGEIKSITSFKIKIRAQTAILLILVGVYYIILYYIIYDQTVYSIRQFLQVMVRMDGVVSIYDEDESIYLFRPPSLLFFLFWADSIYAKAGP